MAKSIELDRLLREIQSNYSMFIGGVRQNEEKLGQLYSISEITKDIFTRSESVPELNFSSSLFELLCQLQIPVEAGWMSNEELKESFSDKGEKTFLEMFINPPDLFMGGKIRPDVVFRFGVGNYVIFEIDSFLYHSNQKQLVSDKERERKIQSLGHPVFRFAAKEVLEKSWDVAVEAVRILENQKFLTTKGKKHG